MASALGGRRAAIPTLIIGIVLPVVALVGPPYRTCSLLGFPR